MRRWMAVILALAMALMTASCADEQRQAEDAAGALVVYYAGRDIHDQVVQYAASAYESRYPDREIVLTEVYEEDIPRLRTEIMAGRGPDVLLQEGEGWLDPYYNTVLIDDPQKAIEAGLFADCTDVVAELAGEDACLPAALEAGAMDGRQYVVPLFLFTDYLTANPRMGLVPAEGLLAAPMDVSETIAYLDKSLAAARDANLPVTDVQETWPTLFSLLYPDLSAMEDFSDLEPFLAQMKAGLAQASGCGALPTSERFGFTYNCAYTVCWQNISHVCRTTGMGRAVLPVLNQAEGLTAFASDWVGIVASTPRPQAAKDFLRILLSEGCQNYSAISTKDLPVRQGSVTHGAQLDAEAYCHVTQSNSFPSGIGEEEAVQYLEDNAARINRVLLSVAQHRLVLENFLPYLEGQQDFAACASEAYRAYRLYLEE